MPLFGAHMSIAGGLHLAFERIAHIRGRALQIFTRNQRQWRAPGLTGDAVRLFREHWEKTGRIPVASHASYLVNLATADQGLAAKSVAAVVDELERAEALGIAYLILHPGARGEQSVDAGLERFTHNMDRAVSDSKTDQVMLLIENTAGQGTGLGSRFEELAYILTGSRFGPRLGVCFDTSHAFGAGYDIGSSDGYRKTFALFDRLIGIERLRFFHINDCKKGLGSRVDRHWHIGKGTIGLEGFRTLVNDPRFQHHPMVLETPKGKDLTEDKENLSVLRSLVSSSKTSRRKA